MKKRFTGEPMALAIEISWYRIWNVVARGGDISAELDHHVSICRRGGDTRQPDQIRVEVVDQINEAISLGQVLDRLQEKRKLIDAAVRQAMGMVNKDDNSA